MPQIGKIESGFLFRRKITKLANGAKIDWNAGPVVEKIEEAIASVNKRGAYKVARLARSMLRSRAYKTGELYRSVKVYPSKYQYNLSVKYGKRVYTEWIILAGNDLVDYAMHVEAGRYFKESGTRVAAVPFMRSSAALTRKWLRPRMKQAIKRAIR